MDYTRESVNRKVHPRDKANYLSLFTFCIFVFGIYKQGYKKGYDEDTLPQNIKRLRSSKCANEIEIQWKHEKQCHIKPSVIRLLWNTYFWKYFLLFIVMLLLKLSRGFLEPPATVKLVVYFKGQTEITKSDAMYNAILVLTLNLLDFFILRNIYLFTQEICCEMRTALSSLIYRKVLKLKHASKASVGNIVTLITKDIDIIETAMMQVHFVFVGIVQICLVCYMLYKRLKEPSIGGIIFFIVSLSIQVTLGKIISKLRVRTDRLCDDRLQAIKQAISAVKLIKIYCWETFFYQRISKLRRKEMNTMLKETIFRFLLKVVGRLTISLSVYTLIMTRVWLGYSITTDIVFYILSCFRQLDVLLVRLLPNGIGKFAELYGACSRIEKVLHAEELEQLQEQVAMRPSIVLKNVNVSINGKSILKDITFQCESNGLICLSGSIGSGKTLLLTTILREYSINSGALNTIGRISYASQNPWIFPSTIRQNIIFGNPFDRFKYENIIRACALDYDLKILEKGDETVLLEYGANLSKGQQIRVNLARALYRDAEIYLLDDSFSSLDFKVNQFIFHHGVLEYLKNKICILVTQDSNHIKCAKHTIFLENGRITFVKKAPTLPKEILKDEDAITLDYGIEGGDKDSMEKDKLIKQEKTTYFEDVVKGRLQMQYYFKYLQFGRGYVIFIIIILLYFLNQVCQSCSTKLLTQWADKENKVSLLANDSNSTLYQETVDSKNQSILTYTLFISITVLLSFMKTYAYFDFARVASIKAHAITLKNVLNAEMKFFDTHMIGNILNRFSNDMNNSDEHLPNWSNDFFSEMVTTFGILLLISMVNWMFAMMIFCLIICYFLKVYTLNVGFNLKRLESSTRSPIVGYVNATLDDLVTVRASRCQELLAQEFDKHLDKYTCVHYTSALCIQAIGFFVDVLSTILMISFVIYFFINKESTSGGDVGLVLVQILSLNGHLQWGIRMWVSMQIDVTSVERIIQYAFTKQEEKSGICSNNWLQFGRINYFNVNFTYPKCKKSSLKNINTNIEPNETLALIGRTGSGKTTFISALFRLYDYEGKILIDGKDIKTLNLDNLRSHIDLVPQKSFLFSGTIRENLDPLQQFEDEKIWSVLQELNLNTSIPDIYMSVKNDGSNFTTGQKQLLCFARALLRDKKIVILDEMSSNLDCETEMLSISLIKKYFNGKTVIIIAHKLNTIMDCNRVLVFENGEIIESGTRVDLMSIENGYFSALMKKMV